MHQRRLAVRHTGRHAKPLLHILHAQRHHRPVPQPGEAGCPDIHRGPRACPPPENTGHREAVGRFVEAEQRDEEAAGGDCECAEDGVRPWGYLCALAGGVGGKLAAGVGHGADRRDGGAPGEGVDGGGQGVYEHRGETVDCAGGKAGGDEEEVDGGVDEPGGGGAEPGGGAGEEKGEGGVARPCKSQRGGGRGGEGGAHRP